MKVIAKYVCEIRFKPNPLILDKRGEITKIYSDSIFKNWNILNNKIDFFNEGDLSASASLSYKNLVVMTSFPHDTDFFVETTKNFIKKAWDKISVNDITRMGVRSFLYVDDDKSFKEYFEGYKKHIPSFAKKSFINANLVDIGINLNFAEDDKYFNVMSGPMLKEQVISLFQKDDKEGIPETGMYVEVDYFKKSFKPFVTQKNIFKILNDGVAKANEISSSFAKIIQE